MLMFDLETWGTSPGCAIRSIGAAHFEWNSIGETFYVNVSDDSNSQARFTKDAATVKWWADQKPEAKAAFESPKPIPIHFALDRFLQFVARGGLDVQVWCRGLSFDVAIVKSAVALVDMWHNGESGLSIPWRYNNERDTRTLIEAWPAERIEFVGTAHNALDDALHEIKVLQTCWANRQGPIVEARRAGISDARAAVMDSACDLYEQTAWGNGARDQLGATVKALESLT